MSSRADKMRAVLRDGERFVCLSTQGLPLTLTSPPTAEQIAATGGTCLSTPAAWGFRFPNGSVAKSPSGACKLVLRREGATNEYNGPRQVFVERNGAWVSYKQLCDELAA